MTNRGAGIFLILFALTALWAFNTGRLAAILQIIKDPNVVPARTEYVAGLGPVGGGSSGSSAGTGGIIGGILGGIFGGDGGGLQTESSGGSSGWISAASDIFSAASLFA